MNGKGSTKRIVALRRLEEEREEAAVLHHRQLRDSSLQALQVIEQDKALASGALHQALLAGERGDAISAEMALACWPIRQHALEQALARREGQLELAVHTCAEARLRRRQAETAFASIARDESKRDQLREQKVLDDWSARNRPMPLWSAMEDESFQREDRISAASDGTDRAKVDIG
jgi:hypothetical protein